MYRYAAQNVDSEVTSRAVGKDLPVKPKFAIEVAAAIRGRPLGKAKQFLEDVVALKRAVPFRKTTRNIKHRKDGVGPGKYPVKVAAAFLRVLKDAESNAEYKGLDPERMFVRHAAANRASPIRGIMPRAQGRATAWDTHTSHLEIVLEEREPKESGAAKDAAPAAEKPKPMTAAERKKLAARRKAAKKKAEQKKEE
jgi:large subunit ribosomal protein L22